MALFEVTVKCEVIKTVIVDCERKEEAEANPFEHAVHEIETDQLSWEVQCVKLAD